MKKLIVSSVLIIGLIIALGFAGYRWWTANIKPVSTVTEKQRVVIDKGMSAQSIASKLYTAGLIRNSLAFKLYTQIYDKSDKIQPGEFTLSPSMSLSEIVSHLLKGPDELWVTIPEGLRREEIPPRFIKALDLEGDEADNFRSEFLVQSRNKEGYLYPDTYLFPRDVSAQKAVERLVSSFNIQIEKIGKEYPENYSLEEVVVIASLIEKETKGKTPDERPLVAGIFYNRLKAGWPLQVDATAQYAQANLRCAKSTDCDWWVEPTLYDLEVVSPYNTYKNQGLPPHAICSPGFYSLMAAIQPQPSEYFYYIHADGVPYYAKTVEEHNQNIKKYLR